MTDARLKLLIVLPAIALALGLRTATVGATTTPGDDAYPAAAEQVFHCDFSPEWDQNFDGWPNDWTRRRGQGYPHYVDIRIDESGPPSGGRSLRVSLDGGAAAATSPPIPISHVFEYIFQMRLRAERLHHDRAFASVALLDAQHRPLRTVRSERIQQTDGWQTVRIGPLRIEPRARFATITLQVEPHGLEDLAGTVWFGDVWLGRIPHMRLEMNEPSQLYVLPASVETTCTFSGSFAAAPTVQFELTDALGQRIDFAERQADLKPGPSGGPGLDGASPAEGTLQFAPKIGRPGWYRLAARLILGNRVLQQDELAFAVVTTMKPGNGGEFGWSLPRGDRPVPLPALARLLTQSGVQWVKFPLWLNEDESDEAVQQLSGFVERLNTNNIGIVGLLATPPDSLQRRFGSSSVPAAEVFACDPKVWYPSIETTFTRMAIQVRCWQLGSDNDPSFASLAQPVDRVAEIKTVIDRIAQDADLGLPWEWTRAFPSAGRRPLPWRFLSLSANPPLEATELAWHLDQSKETGTRRFVMLEPLEPAAYPLDTRIIDLVERMLAAKIHGADAVFASDPFAPESGLMTPEGVPGPLFLPWRTTSVAVGGAKHLGSLVLPGGSRNHVFARDDEAIVVVRNDRAVCEPMSVGPRGQLTDLWGYNVALPANEQRQTIDVDRFPRFLGGMSIAAARWQMDLQLQRGQLPSTFDRPHKNELKIANPFRQGVHGRVTVVPPPQWKIEPREAGFNLAEGETWNQPLEMLVPNTASSGRHLVRFDFDLQADERLQLSVYRWVEVGLGDLFIDLSQRLRDDGELEIVQRMVNQTSAPVSFRCGLFVPGRRALKSQVVELAPGEDVKVYRLANGRELIGKPLWLRAEEINGSRVLNYRVTVQ